MQIGAPVLLKLLAHSELLPAADPIRVAESLRVEIELHIIGATSDVRLSADLVAVSLPKREDRLKAWGSGDAELIWE